MANPPPVLLLHGYTDSAHSFALMQPHLPGWMRAAVPDQRGHGDAEQMPHGYTPADFAEDALDVLDGIGPEPAVVVGHSMGSLVALSLALAHPTRVAGLVLVGALAAPAQNAVVQELAGPVMRLADPLDPAFVEAFQRSTVARPVPEAFMATVVRQSLKVPAFVWRQALRGMLDVDLRPRLHEIGVPVLLLWGDRDAIVSRAEQEEMAARIQGARLEVLAGTGHAPHWEEPERVAAAIAAFAQGIMPNSAVAPASVLPAPAGRPVERPPVAV